METENISQTSSLFGGKTFCKWQPNKFCAASWSLVHLDVINGIDDNTTKTKLEYMIKKNGGQFVQTDEKAIYVIAGKHSKHFA